MRTAIFALLLYSLLEKKGLCHKACDPQYVPASFNYKLYEDLKPGRPVGKLLFHGDEPLVSYDLIRAGQNDSVDSYFQINSKRLILSKRLDYEAWMEKGKPNPFILTIRCEVNPTRRTTVHNISLQIIDVNDNAPYLVNVPYFVNVKRDSYPGTVIIHNIQAMDDDSFDNGNVTIQVNENDDFSSYFKFKMTGHNRGNLLLTKRLDAVKESRIRLDLKAKDHGTNSLSSISTLNIAIVDSQQVKKPTFSRVSYIVELSENTPKGSIVTPISGSIRAFMDASFSDDLPISYRIIDPSASCPFSIDPQTGILKYNGRYPRLKSSFFLKACASNLMCERALLTIKRTNSTINNDLSVLHFDVVKAGEKLIQTYATDDFTYLGDLVLTESLDISNASITISCNNSGEMFLRLSEQGSRNPRLLIRRNHNVPSGDSVKCKVLIFDLAKSYVTYDVIINILHPITFDRRSYCFEIGNNTARHSILGQVKVFASQRPRLVYRIQSSSSLLTNNLCIAEYGTVYWCRSPPKLLLKTRDGIYFTVEVSYSGIPSSLVSINASLLTHNRDSEAHVAATQSSQSNDVIYLFFGSVVAVICLSIIATSVFLCYYRHFSSSTYNNERDGELGSLDVYDDLIKYTNRHDSSVMIMPLLKNYGESRKSGYCRYGSKSSLSGQYARLNAVEQEESVSSAFASNSSQLSPTPSSIRTKRIIRESAPSPYINQSQTNASQCARRLTSMSERQRFNYRHSGYRPTTMANTTESLRRSTSSHPKSMHDEDHSNGENSPTDSKILSPMIDRNSRSESVHPDKMLGRLQQDRSIDELTFAM
ncbi:hypothetical protein ACOME3_008770 [Neoechinorhynchus agilis]